MVGAKIYRCQVVQCQIVWVNCPGKLSILVCWCQIVWFIMLVPLPNRPLLILGAKLSYNPSPPHFSGGSLSCQMLRCEFLWNSKGFFCNFLQICADILKTQLPLFVCRWFFKSGNLGLGGRKPHCFCPSYLLTGFGKEDQHHGAYIISHVCLISPASCSSCGFL